MRSSTYPPAIKNYLKIVPVSTMFLYLVLIHPLMIWNIINHSKERIERLYFKRNAFDKWLTRRDDYLRQSYIDKLEWQPNTPQTQKRPLSRI